MDAHGVYVLYGADHDDVIGEVAHDLELELLPAGDALLDEGAAYGARVEAFEDGAAELAVVAYRSSTLATEGKAWADDQGEAELRCEFLCFGEAADRAARWHLQADTAHGLGEELAVLRLVDRRDRSSEKLHVEFAQDAGLVEFDGEVERRLASQGGEQGVGALAAQYLGDGFGRQGLYVG